MPTVSRRIGLGRSQLGMTILEVLISLTLAGMFFAMALPSIVQSYTRLKLADTQGRALNLALSKAEEFSSMPAGATLGTEGRAEQFYWHVSPGDVNDQPALQGDPNHQVRNYRISVLRSDQDVLASVSIQRLEK